MSTALELPTTMPGLALRELSRHDVHEYHALVQRSARHLTRLGDYLEVVAASEDEVAEELSEPSVPALRFAIRLDDVLVGRADLNPVAPPRYGLGYWLAQDATGRGVGTAAVATLITYARDTLAATDVFAGVTHNNTKSVELLLRLGFGEAQDFDEYTRFHLALAHGGES